MHTTWSCMVMMARNWLKLSKADDVSSVMCLKFPTERSGRAAMFVLQYASSLCGFRSSGSHLIPWNLSPQYWHKFATAPLSIPLGLMLGGELRPMCVIPKAWHDIMELIAFICCIQCHNNRPDITLILKSSSVFVGVAKRLWSFFDRSASAKWSLSTNSIQLIHKHCMLGSSPVQWRRSVTCAEKCTENGGIFMVTSCARGLHGSGLRALESITSLSQN